MKLSRQGFTVSLLVIPFCPQSILKFHFQLTSVPTSEVAKKCFLSSIRVRIAPRDDLCFNLFSHNYEMLCRSSHGQMPCLETEHWQKNCQQNILPRDLQQPD